MLPRAGDASIDVLERALPAAAARGILEGETGLPDAEFASRDVLDWSVSEFRPAAGRGMPEVVGAGMPDMTTSAALDFPLGRVNGRGPSIEYGFGSLSSTSRVLLVLSCILCDFLRGGLIELRR